MEFSVPWRKLGKADLEFKVKRNGSVLGTLKVSKGGVEGVVRGSKYGSTMTWADFGDLMKQHGKKKKR